MNIFKIFILIFSIFINKTVVKSVVIDHENNDIRRTILSNFQDKPKKELFKVYHFLFQKKYDLNSKEGINKYKTFKNNLKFIQKQNTIQNSYSLGITEFTDLSADEFTKTYLRPFKREKITEKFLNSQIENSSTNNFVNSDVETEEEDEILLNKYLNNDKGNSLNQKKIDWTNSMNPPMNQGVCGSCWAFSVIGAIEGNYNVKFGNSPGFSQQQLVDCDSTNYGCAGGMEERALDYIKQNGIAFYNEYPYISGVLSKPDTCKASTLTMNKIVEGYESCPKEGCTREIQRSLLKKGPIMVGIDGDGRNSPTDANSIFQHYTKGVLDFNCKTDNHAVIIIGVDFDEKGEYILGRNSWGPSWGEKGNFRFRTRDSDKTCFMEATGILPLVKQTLNPVPNPHPEKPGCIKLYSECDFKGQVKEICGNVANIENFSKISGYSIEILKSARLYEKPYCEGYHLDADESQVCLVKNKLQNNIKSIINEQKSPPDGCVWLYDDYCLSGKKVEICEDVSDLNNNKYKFGNKTSSFKYGNGVQSITIYLDANFEGNNFMMAQEMYSLYGSWFDRDMESIKINK